ncbi:BMP family ABC transporter substrate-binding protein [Deinococcus sonorensis]|uniref:BMP family ABC transporter substrate-binding protein n=2 Tax=Deinococcus sonorensis TaxID=309891 RepID=A0AAU7UCN2_9DEIO
MKQNTVRSLALLSLVLTSSVVAQSTAVNIGLVFDPAGKYDHGINQAVNDGLERATQDFGVSVSSYTPVDAADAAAKLASYAGDNQLVIGVGHFNVAGVSKLAASAPRTHFAVVDDLPKGSNTMGIRFRENEGAFMAGYIAGSTSSTSVVGIVMPAGAGSTPFVSAYRAGTKLVCPNCKVLVGTLNGSGDDTASAEAVSKTLLKQGADILFVGATSGKLGVISAVRSQQCFKASALPAGVKFNQDVFAKVPKAQDYQGRCGAQSRPVFFIGWESDYLSLGDTDADAGTLNTGLTAIVKRADNAVYSLIDAVVKKRAWRPGDNGFGFQNAGLEVAINKYNEALFDKAMLGRLKTVQGLIKSGSVRLGD